MKNHKAGVARRKGTVIQEQTIDMLTSGTGLEHVPIVLFKHSVSVEFGTFACP